MLVGSIGPAACRPMPSADAPAPAPVESPVRSPWSAPSDEAFVSVPAPQMPVAAPASPEPLRARWRTACLGALLAVGAVTSAAAGPLAAQAVSTSAPIRPLDPAGTCASAMAPLGTSQPVEAGDVRGTVSFCSFESLSEKQRALLRQHFRAHSEDEAAREWQSFASRRPTHAATFLATTHALGLTRIEVGDPSRSTTALDLLTRVDILLDDRIEGEIDHPLLERWQTQGGRFEIQGTDGQVHKGRMQFNKGDRGGSVHYGYERQGYTGRSAPRIQIQLDAPRPDGTMAAQVDVDYRSPWKGGIIPNPLHLRHDNSVVLDHLDTYVGVFGNPGFELRPAEPPAK